MIMMKKRDVIAKLFGRTTSVDQVSRDIVLLLFFSKGVGRGRDGQ